MSRSYRISHMITPVSFSSRHCSKRLVLYKHGYFLGESIIESSHILLQIDWENGGILFLISSTFDILTEKSPIVCQEYVVCRRIAVTSQSALYNCLYLAPILFENAWLRNITPFFKVRKEQWRERVYFH